MAVGNSGKGRPLGERAHDQLPNAGSAQAARGVGGGYRLGDRKRGNFFLRLPVEWRRRIYGRVITHLGCLRTTLGRCL